jgi:hypothetical protein
MNQIKPIILLFFFFITAINLTYCQIGFGPTMGVQLVTINDTEAEGLTRPTGGFFVQQPLGKYITARIEVLYSPKGYANESFEWKDVEGQSDFAYSLEENYLRYIDIPLVFQFLTDFSVITGIQPSFLIASSRYSYSDFNLFNPSNGDYSVINTLAYTSNTTSLYKKLDMGIILGFEFEICNIRFGSRACYSLLDATPGNSNHHNASLILSLGYIYKYKQQVILGD